MKTDRKKAAPLPREEQFRLVMECRDSGLSDRAWCREHSINPETFRNWAKKFRDEQTENFPQKKSKEGRNPVNPLPEIVRLSQDPRPDEMRLEKENPFSLEISLSGSRIRMTNEVSPEIVRSVLRILSEAAC